MALGRGVWEACGMWEACRIHRENGGHGELVHELAVDQQAFDAAAFHPETHAFVQAGPGRGVRR